VIGVLVSGEGTNLQALIGEGLPIVAVASNQADAPALERARTAGIATAAFELKRSPSKSSGTVRKIESGMMLYPLGGKEDMWWEVEDENGNVGWVLNTKLAPMAVEAAH
jgi:uncharacterized protein YgiM (DUF1202 family)